MTYRDFSEMPADVLRAFAYDLAHPQEALARIREERRAIERRMQDNGEGTETMTLQQKEVRALLALSMKNIPTDIQELLVHGSPRLGVAPGALRAAIIAIDGEITTSEKA